MRVYNSLTRPKLKRGAEWKLTAINGFLVIAMVLMAVLTHWWWILLVAAIFYWPGQWLLRQSAKVDPQWLAVYARALSHPLIREPNGYAYTRNAKPKPVLPKREQVGAVTSMKTDNSLASVVPYGSFTPEGEVYLQGRGLMVGFEFRGLPLESSSAAQLASAADRMVEAMRHLGTNDMLQAQFYRLPHLAYPDREFPSGAARLIDDERRSQFEAENYWRTLSRLYITTQVESVAQSRIRSALFGSGDWNPHVNQVLQRFRERLMAFQDALGGTIDLRRLNSEETFRDLILAVTGRDFPARLPTGRVRLNEVIASERWYGGVAPWVGELHLRPVSITAYPGATIPQMLAGLLRNPGLLTVSARFICLDPVDTQDALKLERIFWVREAQGSMFDMVLRALHVERRKSLHQDAEQQVAEVDEAMSAAAAGMPFGWCTITAVVKDTDPERATARARALVKDLSAMGLTARVEDANAVEAAQGTWPGDGWSNVRRPLVTAGNFAELTLPVEHWPGTPFVDSPFYEKDTVAEKNPFIHQPISAASLIN
jgi:type IV secretory pathway VirB4 component/type IV secretory pathway TrbD component